MVCRFWRVGSVSIFTEMLVLFDRILRRDGEVLPQLSGSGVQTASLFCSR
jgi:hypothetical protein